MSLSNDSDTSLTLLQRLRTSPADEESWQAFVKRYGGKIHSWCRGWGLQASDAEDVTQNVLLELSRQMQQFEYDPSGKFRAWLKTVTHHAWYDYRKRRSNRECGSGDSQVLTMLNSIEARDDLIREIEEECNRELFEAAMKRVQSRVQPHTWEAFRLLTFEKLSGKEVGERLNIRPGTAFVANNKVRHMLQEEVERLDRSEPNEG